MFSLLVLCFLSLFGLAFGLNNNISDWQNVFSYNQNLNIAGTVKIYWNILSNDLIDIAIEFPTLGWFAIGFSESGGMTNSDVMLNWVQNGTSYLQDRYVGNTQSQPQLDTVQNLNLTFGAQLNGKSYARFIRAIKPCDSSHDKEIIGTTKVIYAWNDNAPDIHNMAATFLQHSSVNRGVQSVNLLTGTQFPVNLESDVQSFDVTVSSYAVPSADTTYYGTYYELPATATKKHIVRFEPIVTPGNELYVHHIVLYKCVASDGITSNNLTLTCFTTQQGCPCDVPVVAWAIGGQAFNFPQDVGYEMSTAVSGIHFIRMEIHYNNPNMNSGIVDSSGIRIIYTPTLRTHEAGLIEFTLQVTDFGQFIPPGLDNVVNKVYVPSNCTQTSIPTNGTNIFASFLHTHDLGRKIILRHFRNGVELPPIDQNLAYDFDYQQSTPHLPYVVVMPGDEFILECYYNSENISDWRFGGLSSTDEMCQVYFFGYPKPDLAFAASWFPDNSRLGWLSESQNNHNISNATGNSPYYTWVGTGAAGTAQYNLLEDTSIYPNRHIYCENELGNMYVPATEMNIASQYTPYTDNTTCNNLENGTQSMTAVFPSTPSPTSENDDSNAQRLLSTQNCLFVLFFLSFFF